MTRRITIHKFGGAALADAESIRHVAAIVVRDDASRRRVIVASALSGVTESLLGVLRQVTVASDEEIRSAVARIAERHHAVIAALLDGEAAACVHRHVDAALAELATLALAARLAGGAAPRELDLGAARGERLAARILAAVLRREGIRAAYVDATDVLATDAAFGQGAPDMHRTARLARAALEPLLAAGEIAVVPGFFGAGPAGEVVTLGRGGSDLTATLLGRVLGARDVVLWKDVPGLLTADPRAVPGARPIVQLNVREAAEVAQYGARVLHPAALVPLTSRMRVFVRPFADPSAAGTEISARAVDVRSPVKAIAATMDQALVTIAGRGLSVRPGIVGRAFIALDAAGVGASLISQAATEYAFAFTIRAVDGARAVDALRCALGPEIAHGDIESVEARVGIATVGVVGLRLADEPGVAARVFAALAGARINVLAAAQGSGSGGSLSLVVDATRAIEAQRVIHDEFQLHKQGGGRSTAPAHTDVVILGAGTIGRELLSQLSDRRATTGAALRVCGVIDSTGYVFAPAGLSRRHLSALCRHKAEGGRLRDCEGGTTATARAAVEAIAAHALSHPVLVDVTAADTGPTLELALSRGWNIVLANKVPLAADLATSDRLHRAALEQNRRVLHEATVGAGLPVIDTLRKLVDAGDRVLRIEGCPSGTLGYLFGALGRGVRFSAALRAAVDAGYAEPDPRIDLCGLDVARKALILGRLIGFTGDLADVRVESLVPPALAEVPRDEFLARLDELDAAWDGRVTAARREGKVLRYRARVSSRGVQVGLVAVSVTDPLGSLSGTDNQFSFTTTRYRAQPLVITGPGAGPAVTAAGVVNDLLRLAETGVRHSRIPSGQAAFGAGRRRRASTTPLSPGSCPASSPPSFS